MGNLIQASRKNFKVRPLKEMVDDFIDNLEDQKYAGLLEDYISNSKVLDGGEVATLFYVSKHRTNLLLSELGFQWERPKRTEFREDVGSL